MARPSSLYSSLLFSILLVLLVMIDACTACMRFGRENIPKDVVSATSSWWVSTGGRKWQEMGNRNEQFAAQRGVSDDHSTGSVVCLFCLCFFLYQIASAKGNERRVRSVNAGRIRCGCVVLLE